MQNHGWVRALLGALVILVAATGALAAINSPVPAGAYITKNGLDYAWANPVPGGIDFSYQGGQGWRLPTLAELQSGPLATDFLKPGGNVPFGGTDPVSNALFQAQNAAYTTAASAGACATPYFSSSYLHCDWTDGQGQPSGPWAGLPGANALADQLVVRGALVPVVAQQIPALGPQGMLLLSIGLAVAGLAFARRRRALK